MQRSNNKVGDSAKQKKRVQSQAGKGYNGQAPKVPVPRNTGKAEFMERKTEHG